MSETITPGAALLVLPVAGLPTILAADDKVRHTAINYAAPATKGPLL